MCHSPAPPRLPETRGGSGARERCTETHGTGAGEGKDSRKHMGEGLPETHTREVEQRTNH